MPGVDAWGLWQPVFRDVVLVDAKNVKRSTYNLTEHDLNDPVNYAELKQRFLDSR